MSRLLVKPRIVPQASGATIAVALTIITASAGSAAAEPLAPSPAQASAPTSAETPEPPANDPSAVFADVERPWLFSPDATAPPPGRALATMSVGYAQIDRGAARPFAGNIAQAGAVFGAGVEVGVFRFASLHAEGLLSGSGGSVNAGAMAGATFYPLPAKSWIDIGISIGYLRELGGSDGIWGRASASADLGPVRASVAALAEHVFAPDRDPVDLLLSAGASYRVASFFRLGAEYVVQDLEGAWEEEEEDGGIRHFLSPTATFEIYHRVRLSAGPAFGLSQGSPPIAGRLQAGYSF